MSAWTVDIKPCDAASVAESSRWGVALTVFLASFGAAVWLGSLFASP